MACTGGPERLREHLHGQWSLAGKEHMHCSLVLWNVRECRKGSDLEIVPILILNPVGDADTIGEAVLVV